MHRTPHECDVLFVDQSVAELPCQVCVRQIIFGHNHQSGGAAIEAVNDSGPPLTPDAAEILNMMKKRVDQRAICVTYRWVHDHAWRLFDDDNIRVVVDDCDWKRLGFWGGWSRWWYLKGDQAAVAHGRAGMGRNVVDTCHPLLDETLDLGPCSVPEVRGQHVVKTLAAVLGCDLKAYDL